MYSDNTIRITDATTSESVKSNNITRKAIWYGLYTLRK